MTDFIKPVQILRRTPTTVPKFNTQFAEMIGKQTRFIVSRALISKIKTEFFQTGELAHDDTYYNENIKDNYFGAPIYDYLSFKGGEYTDLEGRNITYGGGIGKEFIITPVLLEVSQNKRIVKTEIQGRDGSDKEFISNGDLMFTARGNIVSETNEYPAYEIMILEQILSANTSIEIKCDFMFQFLHRSYDIVIESFNIPQQRGMRNSQPFEIVMSSDNIIELTEEEAIR